MKEKFKAWVNQQVAHVPELDNATLSQKTFYVFIDTIFALCLILLLFVPLSMVVSTATDIVLISNPIQVMGWLIIATLIDILIAFLMLATAENR